MQGFKTLLGRSVLGIGAGALLAAAAVAGNYGDDSKATAQAAMQHDATTQAVIANTVVDVAQGVDGFSTLVAALTAADLVDTLKSDGPFTVFAPTDAAFAALPEGALDALLADTEKLTEVLTLHVAAGKALAADVVGMSGVDTVQGTRLDISVGESDVIVGGARVLQTDISASNGVIHVIDRVLLPRG